MNKYNQLAVKLKTGDAAPELKKAMTHRSFYKKDDETRSNSRYVFCGMFAFKGEAARMLLQYVSGSGTHLQHALGKLFKNEHLERLFAYFELHRYIRHSADFDADKHRHIFVYGLLGWLCEHASEEVKREFLSRHFIMPFANELTPPAKNNDWEAQCSALSRMIFGCKVKLTLEKADDRFRATVTAGNDRTLADESSASYRYCRRKALKKALHALMDVVERQEGYELRRQRLNDILLQKQEAQKAEKAKEYDEKLERKRKERLQKKALQKALAVEADNKRRKAKASAKRRKEEEARQAAEKAAKMANMSANKRRHLQDKEK